MKNKNFTQEVLIITMVMIISYLIYFNLKTIDLFTYLFTTVDIIGKDWIPFLVFINIMLLLMIILYIFKQITYKFKLVTTNYLLISFCVLFIILLNVWTEQSNLEDKSIFIDDVLTIYPPLSAFNDSNILAINKEVAYFKTSIFYLQLFIILVITVTLFMSLCQRTVLKS